MEIILTYHAKQRMVQHAISLDQIKRAIKQGSKINQTDGLLAKFCYLEVAYKIREGKYIIKTVKIIH